MSDKPVNIKDSSGMAHIKKKRIKYDQARTPWMRIGSREKEILDRGWNHVQSVPYKVSLRWLFYRLLQDGFYKSKSDYKNNFTKLFSRARHTNYGEWRPSSLADDNREIIPRAGGCKDIDVANSHVASRILDAAYISLDHFYRQKNYIELWYEANAMTSQFKYYTEEINLIPMGGTASIPYKWEIAKRLESANFHYEIPIKILYFGDADPSGHTIKDVIEMDVKRWCRVGFEIIWCGLTTEQAESWNVPENFDKKGYQWEALPDEGAKEIITAAIKKYIDLDIIQEVKQEENDFTEKWREELENIVDKLREHA